MKKRPIREPRDKPRKHILLQREREEGKFKENPKTSFTKIKYEVEIWMRKPIGTQYLESWMELPHGLRGVLRNRFKVYSVGIKKIEVKDEKDNIKQTEEKTQES